MLYRKVALSAVVGAVSAFAISAQAQPALVLTEQGAADIRASDSETYPLFNAAMEEAKARVAKSKGEGIIVPEPLDPGGGYSHERHKENYKVIHDAGILYQLTGDRSYLQHAESMLFAYADMYNDLPLHPARKNQAPGRLFWQSLNEAMWMVYSIQGYDAIRDDLSSASRERIENGVFRPMAQFLSVDSPQTFRKIHNHGTWAAAAVGMTGYAIGDDELVERSIMGLDGDGSSGFLAQLDQLFSPDGYYTEGPYYQRFAMMPFALFGQAIENNDPDRKIFSYRDEILLKAIVSTIEQSYAGKFFPINDAIKEKGIDTQELVYGVSIAYGLTGDRGLLSIAELQGKTVISGEGLNIARSVAKGRATPFVFKSQVMRDGPNGDQGGLAILRMGEGMDNQALIAKHTGQGLGHGHFDKLSIILYDDGQEVLSDYGAARFLNVPSKAGGRYLPENTTWAKSTIAHNSLVVNETTQFDGDWRVAQESWPTIEYFDATDTANIVVASIDDAYPDAVLRRTTVQLAAPDGGAPMVLDIAEVEADKSASVDLPIYFHGQLTDSSLDIKRFASQMPVLGEDNGYQHLWVEAEAKTLAGKSSFTWLNKNRFYTYHAIGPKNAKASVVRIGANDPDFNLVSQQGIVMRAPKQKSTRFVSLIEPHGLYDPAQEVTVQSDSRVEAFDIVERGDASLVKISLKSGEKVVVGLASPDDQKTHTINDGGKRYRWSGAYKIFKE